MTRRAVANGVTANETYANALGEGRFTGLTTLAFSVLLYPVNFAVRLYSVIARVRLREAE